MKSDKLVKWYDTLPCRVSDEDTIIISALPLKSYALFPKDN